MGGKPREKAWAGLSHHTLVPYGQVLEVLIMRMLIRTVKELVSFLVQKNVAFWANHATSEIAVKHCQPATEAKALRC